MNVHDVVQAADGCLRSTGVPRAFHGWGPDALEVGRRLRGAADRALQQPGRPVSVEGTGITLTADPGAPRIDVRGGGTDSFTLDELARVWEELTGALRASTERLDPIARACAQVRITAVDRVAALRGLADRASAPPEDADALTLFEQATGAPWPLASTASRREPTLATSLPTLRDGGGATPMRAALIASQLARLESPHWALVVADRDVLLLVGASGRTATAREALWPGMETVLFSAAPVLAAAWLVAHHGLSVDGGLSVEHGAFFIDGAWR